jgi:hypothetical protein
MSPTATVSTPRQSAVLPHESQESFDQLAARLRAEFLPEGENQAFLVDRMIQARWALIRFERLQAEAFEEILTAPDSSDASPDGRLLAVYTQRSNVLEKLERHIKEAERSYYQALRQFQATRVRTAPKQATVASTKQPEAAPLTAKKLEEVAAEVRAYINRRSQIPPLSPLSALTMKTKPNADLGNPALRL